MRWQCGVRRKFHNIILTGTFGLAIYLMFSMPSQKESQRPRTPTEATVDVAHNVKTPINNLKIVDNDTISIYKVPRQKEHQAIYAKYKIAADPGIRFLYYGIPSTGSRFIRNPIRLLCRLGHWDCFTHCACAKCNDCLSIGACPQSLDHWRARCWAEADRKSSNRLRCISSSSLWRLSRCCPDTAYRDKFLSGRMDVLAEHFENTYEESRQFLSKYYAPESTFTMIMIREPIEYFMSRVAKKKLKSKTNFIENLRAGLDTWMKQEASGRSLDPVINNQALYLGWTVNNNQSLTQLLHYVRKAKLVGTTSNAELALRYLSCLTGWDGRIIGMPQDRMAELSYKIGAPFGQSPIRQNNEPKGRELMKLLTAEDTRKLRRILYADYELYNVAVEMFSSMNASLFHKCPDLKSLY